MKSSRRFWNIRAADCTACRWETLAAAQELGYRRFEAAAVIGSGIGALAQEVAAKKAARVYAVEHALLRELHGRRLHGRGRRRCIRKVNPDLVLFPHTYQTRDFAPKLATRFERSLISDVDRGAHGPGSRPVFVRQLFQGKLNGDIRPTGPGPHFASLQAGAWRAEALACRLAPQWKRLRRS